MVESDSASLELSPSLGDLVADFRSREDVAARDIVLWLRERHPEYGHDGASRVSFDDQPTLSGAPIDSWLSRTRSLFDVAVVPELNGRILLLGLALLDRSLGQTLMRTDFLYAVIDELMDHYFGAAPLGPGDSIAQSASANPAPR